MGLEHFTFTDRTGTELAAVRWTPAGEPQGAIEIVHGMGEHIMRYAPVAQALTDAGFVVYGYDQRGHGKSIGDGEPGLVTEAGWNALVDDIGEFADTQIKVREPGLPVGVLAHSMGSFATQQYLLRDSSTFDSVALSGTAVLDLLEPALDLDAPLDLAMFNAPFDPPRTDFDWLSRDDEQVDRYLADPLCGFGLDMGAAKAMFVGARGMADAEQVATIRSELPIYLAVGDQDPVNGGLALFQPLVDRLEQAGLTVTTKIYPGARHEIVNETNRAAVIDDLVEWFSATLPLSSTR